MSAAPRVIVIGKYGARNAGDEAILQTILDELHQLSPGIDVTVMSEQPKWTAGQNYHCNSTRFSPFNPKFAYLLIRSNAVVIGGGGLLQDDYSIFNLPRYILPSIIAYLAGSRVIIYGVGAGPINTPFGQCLTRIGCRLARCITVRDHESQELLQSIAPGAHVQVTTDIAAEFATRAAAAKTHDKAMRVAFCPSFAFYFGTRPRWLRLLPTDMRLKLSLLPLGFRSRYEGLTSAFATAADWLVREMSAEITFVPFWPKRDLRVIEDISKRMSSQHVVLSDGASPNDLADCLSEQDLVVGMRLHSLIFATSLGIPFVGISYSKKIDRFVNSVGMDDFLAEADGLSGEYLINTIERACVHREEIRQNLVKHGRAMKRQATRNALRLAYVLGVRHHEILNNCQESREEVQG